MVTLSLFLFSALFLYMSYWLNKTIKKAQSMRGQTFSKDVDESQFNDIYTKHVLCYDAKTNSVYSVKRKSNFYYEVLLGK